VDVENEVLRLAELARSAGAHGVVCSGHEAEAVYGRHGAALKLLVPGIRQPGDPLDDQSRTVTPAQAQASGASYLVIGRTVTTARDPRRVMEVITNDLTSTS
jgi:orotidine-5'-phosphate decarboxylase